MECPKCGNILDDNETSCKNCGAKVKENSFNTISKGGGRTQVPTEEEKAEVIREVQQAQQVQAQQQYNDVNSQNYMMFQQQMMTNQKNNNMTLALIVGLIIIVATFGGILLFTRTKGDGTTALKGATPSEEASSKAVQEVETEEPEDVDVKIGRFTITMPGNYETTLKNNMGISKDVANQVQLVYTIMSTMSYSKVVNGSETFKSDLASLGFTVANYKEEVYGGRTWLIFSGTLQERPAMYAVTAVDSYATFQATIFNLGGKSNEALYNELTVVVDGIKTTDNRSSTPSEGQTPSNPSGGNTSPSSPSGGNTTPSTPADNSRNAPSGAVEA